MNASPTGTTARARRLIRDFSQDDEVPAREVVAPTPQQNPQASIQTPRHRKKEDNWLDEAPAPDVTRKRGLTEDFNLEVHEPVMDGPPDVPASAAPRSRSPQATKQYQAMNFDHAASPPAQYQGNNDNVNGATRSRNPPAAQKYQGFAFDDEQHAKPLNFDGDKTIKKHLVTRDTESIAETKTSTTSSTKLANFFGLEVFQVILHNPTTSHQLTKFCQSRFCAENMEFLEKVDRFNALIDELGTTMLDIHKNFISVNAPSPLNLSDNVLTKMNKDLKFALGSALPKMESLFASAQTNTEDLVFSDIYPRFVRHQLVVSATKALAGDRSKYAGLGDCFVLTNPAKADNPIVFASDGFVSVTGYTRRDIIPRNCRFLQGRHSDREAVGRLRMSIENREESVELLLNYKKSKEPFWNLLYTAPLYDENGNVAFFIGGQVNCSTTIHNASDILRVLSYPDDVEDKQEPVEQPAARRSTFGKGFFKSFRSDSTPALNGKKEVGMENALLTKIDNLTIKKQMESFHSAYSKYLVIKYETMTINFFSMSVIDILYGTKPMLGHVIGVNVFSFLDQHAVNIGRDFKSRVKSTLKAGQAISLELNLSTRKFMRYVKFVTHWTPLKDDDGKVCYVVLALGSSQI